MLTGQLHDLLRTLDDQNVLERGQVECLVFSDTIAIFCTRPLATIAHCVLTDGSVFCMYKTYHEVCRNPIAPERGNKRWNRLHFNFSADNRLARLSLKRMNIARIRIGSDF